MQRLQHRPHVCRSTNSRFRAFKFYNQWRAMKNRSFRVTLALWLVLTLTIWNLIRVWTSITWREALNEFSAQPAAAITTTSGILWTALGVLLLWSIWKKEAWAAKLLFGATAGYTIWYWSERLIWQKPHPNWPFAVIVNLVLLIFILFTTKLLSREAYE